MLLAPESDPFFRHMFARMSPGAKFTFMAAQLDEIKKAFAARSRTSHDLDIRHSIRLFGKSYYLVLLAGCERRAVPPAYGNVTKLSHVVALGAAAAAFCLIFVTFF
jgi:hypothetical protein